MATERLRVVVVEDDPAMRSLLVDDLHTDDFRVQGCADATALWQHLRDHPCDLVVLDIGLPDENGFSVCRRLHEQTEVATVIVSGYASNEHQTLGISEGADAYFIKPVESHVLVATLKRLGRRLGQHQEAEAIASIAGWQLLEQGWVLCTPNYRSIPLNAYERGLLCRLFAVDGATVPGDDLRLVLARENHAGSTRDLVRLVHWLQHKVAALSGCRLPLRFDADGGVCIEP